MGNVPVSPAVEYGTPEVADVTWEDSARERLGQIPVFVRGMVTRSVESYCKQHGIAVVTAEVLQEIRSRMPTPKIFGRKDG